MANKATFLTDLLLPSTKFVFCITLVHSSEQLQGIYVNTGRLALKAALCLICNYRAGQSYTKAIG
jgi:hypothetical protein